MLHFESVMRAAHTREDVLSAITDWLRTGGGAQDALDDLELYESISAFLNNDNLHAAPSSASEPEVLSTLWSHIASARDSLRAQFFKQTRRPDVPPPSIGVSDPRSSLANYGSEPPKVDGSDAEELVNNLDSIGATVFRIITHDDLAITSDLLEAQTADSTGWFLPREPTTVAEEVAIQSMYTFLQEIESSPLVSELGSDTLYKLCPPSIRSAIRAYNIVRTWVIAKLAAPRLGLHVRQERMELFLRAIEVCRLRSAEHGVDITSQPSMRSFVEAALTSAVVSPESRMFSRAWQNVANARGVLNDSLPMLLSRRFVDALSTTRPLTVDIGWLLERVMEVITLPDTTSMGPGASTMVNFTKRRYVSCYVNIGRALKTAFQLSFEPPCQRAHTHPDF